MLKLSRRWADVPAMSWSTGCAPCCPMTPPGVAAFDSVGGAGAGAIRFLFRRPGPRSPSADRRGLHRSRLPAQHRPGGGAHLHDHGAGRRPPGGRADTGVHGGERASRRGPGADRGEQPPAGDTHRCRPSAQRGIGRRGQCPVALLPPVKPYFVMNVGHMPVIPYRCAGNRRRGGTGHRPPWRPGRAPAGRRPVSDSSAG